MDVGLRELVNLIWRRKLLIAAVSAGFTLLTAVVLYNIQPRYTAEALVLIDSRAVNVVHLDTAVAALPRDAEAVKSEMEIIASRGLAERVITELDLHHVEEFGGGLKALSVADPTTRFDELDAVTRSVIINRFLAGLAVSQRGGSRVVAVEYTSVDPDRSAVIANAVADAYLVSQLEAKFEVTKRASSWLSEQISTLQDDLAESERAVERYREESGLLQAKGERLSSQQIAELNSEVLRARTATAEAEARLAQVEAQLNSPTGGAVTAGAVLNSATIQRLTDQEAAIRRKIAELSTEFGEKHPRMVSLRAEANNLTNKIRTETEKVVAGLRYDLAVASAREKAMVQTLESAKADVADANQAEVGLRALEREANANRVLLETMMSRFAETSAQDTMDEQQPDSRLISKAQVPPDPSYPMIAPLLAIAAIGGALLGLLSAFGLEALDQSIRSGEEIEGSTGMPSLGFIPQVTDARGQRLSEYALRNPDSPFSESLRNVVWGLKLRWRPQKGVKGPRRNQRLPKSVLITSSMTNEGKTTMATAMARLMAGPDCRVLLIDADCRRPSVHDELQITFQPGLSELLTGEADFNTVLAEDDKSHVKVIPAGNTVADAPALFGSSAFDDLMRKAERMFDLIIIDSPPIMVGADAALLSKHVAATVVAVRWGATPRRLVEAAIAELQADDEQMLTTVLTVVDASKHSRFSYGDSGKYAGKLASYYGRSSSGSSRTPAALAEHNGRPRRTLNGAEPRNSREVA